MKNVTLLHSGKRLLPRVDPAMHTEIQVLNTIDSLRNINLILDERLDLSSIDEEPGKTNELGQRIVRTTTGRDIVADIILLCTGQTPNIGLLKELDTDTVNPVWPMSSAQCSWACSRVLKHPPVSWRPL